MVSIESVSSSAQPHQEQHLIGALVSETIYCSQLHSQQRIRCIELTTFEFVSEFNGFSKQDNGNVHRAAAKVLQAEKAARPAAPCATYCYPASFCSAANLINASSEGSVDPD